MQPAPQDSQAPSPKPQAPQRRQVLVRFRCPFIAWVQLMAVWFWSLQPVSVMRADGDEELGWWYDRSESGLAVRVEVPGGLAVGYGQTRVLQVEVTLETWGVYVNELGEVRTVSEGSVPAAGAALGVGVVSGGGTVSAPEFLDGGGRGEVLFTMGTSGEARVVVEVSYHGVSAECVTVFSQPSAEVWSYDHGEALVTAALSAPVVPAALATGGGCGGECACGVDHVGCAGLQLGECDDEQ